jgi:uncharacterized protein YegP (UPF0339 family)
MYKLYFWKSHKTNQFHFHVKARNGKIVCQGEGYTRKASLLNTVNRLFKESEVNIPFDADITKK